MSYDLHGLWDKGNIWLGNFLNSHTNLIEITEYFDLFWRNNIVPSKLNMGLVFYSRTFVASDTNCLSPACLFDSVGDPGPCSNSLGTLSNAELTDKIVAAGATPVLDKAAAVKIVTIGKEWITYDDAES
jgi:chitinase